MLSRAGPRRCRGTAPAAAAAAAARAGRIGADRGRGRIASPDHGATGAEASTGRAPSNAVACDQRDGRSAGGAWRSCFSGRGSRGRARRRFQSAGVYPRGADRTRPPGGRGGVIEDLERDQRRAGQPYAELGERGAGAHVEARALCEWGGCRPRDEGARASPRSAAPSSRPAREREPQVEVERDARQADAWSPNARRWRDPRGSEGHREVGATDGGADRSAAAQGSSSAPERGRARTGRRPPAPRGASARAGPSGAGRPAQGGHRRGEGGG